MKKILLIVWFAMFSFSCHAQKNDLKWKDFESKEAGIKASFPCEPKKSFRSFQDEPRAIHVYGFDCEDKGIKFLISSKNYLNEFNQDTFKQTFDSNELILKTMFGVVESFNERKDFLTNGFTSRYYEVRPKSGGKVNSLIVLSENRSYELIIGITPDNAKKMEMSNANFQDVSNRFIDSFQVIE